jgi:hypothetical protein
MQAAQPTIVSPAPAEYPDWYNTLLLVRPLTDTASLKFLPYNFETGQLLQDDELTIDTNFSEFVAARPTLAQAVGALTVELGKVAREAELKRLIAADPENMATWEAQLAAVRSEMGCS